MEALDQDMRTQAKDRKGTEMIQDEPYGESGARWITVSPKEMRIRIVLKKAEKEHEKAMVGRSDGAPILTLGTDDVRAAYECLSSPIRNFFDARHGHAAAVEDMSG